MTGKARIEASAAAVAVDADGPLVGLVIFGAPGAGKSALCLSLISSCPWSRSRLVADDVIEIDVAGGRLFGEAPAPVDGLIEARGLGVVRASQAGRIALRFGIDLSAPGARMPVLENRLLCASVSLPVLPAGGQTFAPEAVRALLRSFLGGQFETTAHDERPS